MIPSGIDIYTGGRNGSKDLAEMFVGLLDGAFYAGSGRFMNLIWMVDGGEKDGG